MAPIRPIQYLKDYSSGPSYLTSYPSSSSTQTLPEVHLHVPSLGVLVIPPPNSVHVVAPTLSGEVEIRIPDGYGRTRCLGIRLILVGWCRLDHGEGRGVEADIISQQSLVVKESTVLEEGSQRFPFTMIIPRDSAQLDAVTTNKVAHHLFAIVDGLQPGLPTFPILHDPKIAFPINQINFHPDDRTPSNQEITTSPPEYVSHTQDYMSTRPGQARRGLSARQGSGREGSIPILTETLFARRIIGIVHNPSALMGVNELDDRFQTFVPDLGMVEGRCGSNVFTACGPYNARIIIPKPSSTTTIHYIRLSLIQHETITSPRDGQVISTAPKMTRFGTLGVLPPKSKRYPGVEVPALWRGKDVGGDDEGEWRGEMRGRFPHPTYSRWSTLPGVKTPIQIRHEIVYDVFFSVQGLDEDGKKMAKSGPGALRLMRRKRGIVMPFCSLLPQVTDLPTYGETTRQTTHDEFTYLVDAPCPSCHTRPSSIICKSCPPSSLPHTRHDTSPKTCLECAGKSLTPAGGPDPGVWVCSCILWEREFGDVKLDTSGEGGGVEWDDEVDWGVERGDRILAEKLDGEWRGKIGH